MSKKYFRVLYLYDQLKIGKVVIMSESADYFEVDRRTIQRDMNEIRCYLAERQVIDSAVIEAVVFDKSKGGYVLESVA